MEENRGVGTGCLGLPQLAPQMPLLHPKIPLPSSQTLLPSPPQLLFNPPNSSFSLCKPLVPPKTSPPPSPKSLFHYPKLPPKPFSLPKVLFSAPSSLFHPPPEQPLAPSRMLLVPRGARPWLLQPRQLPGHNLVRPTVPQLDPSALPAGPSFPRFHPFLRRRQLPASGHLPPLTLRQILVPVDLLDHSVDVVDPFATLLGFPCFIRHVLLDFGDCRVSF